MRVVRVRTGVVLDRGGGALAKMLPFFRLGIGGPVAGGRQYLPWIHVDDLVALYLAALDGGRLDAARQRDRARPGDQQGVLRALGRALHRPAFAPVPALAIRLLYGEMADIVVDRPARRARARAGARLPLRPPRARRGAARARSPADRERLVCGNNRHMGGRAR